LWFGNNTVIIIIGILAAIALPVFLAQREKAWNAAAASELRNMAAAATSCSQENGGDFDGPPDDCGIEANLTAQGWSDDNDVTQTGLDATDQTWEASTFHPDDPTCIYTFTYDEADANSGQVIADAAVPTKSS
jgi:type IV pilus assembly protein PilA